MSMVYKAGATSHSLELQGQPDVFQNGYCVVTRPEVSVFQDAKSTRVFINTSDKDDTAEKVCVVFKIGYYFDTTAKFYGSTASACEGGILAVLQFGDTVTVYPYKNRGSLLILRFNGLALVDITSELTKAQAQPF